MDESKVTPESNPSPIDASVRLVALDILRGFALLGILVMNIQAFSMPEAAYFIPTLYGDLEGINFGVWIISHLFMDQKFMALFSMLFGAGIVLQTNRLDERGVSPTGLYYRRTIWLLLFGLAHAYLLWAGDILTTYAICGLVLYWFRKLAPRYLLSAGVLVLLIAPLLMYGSYQSLSFAPAEVVQEVTLEFAPSEEALESEITAYRGGWITQMDARVPSSLATQSTGLLFYLFWRGAGMMLIGMALYKWGVLTAARSHAFYNRLIVIGFGAGIPLVTYGVFANFSHQWDALYTRLGPGFLYNYVGSVLMSLGYVGLMMQFIKSELYGNLKRRLAAVGRMALSNYLLQTVIATFIFYGHGLGLFGSVPRWGQIIIVLMIWVIQLLLSPVWLRHFRFGPFEWLWRSLAYKQLQPMARSTDELVN